MKKTGLFLITIITLVVVLSSCKKSSSPAIIGNWGLFFYQKTTIDSAVLPTFQYVSDTTLDDHNMYVYKFNSNNTFTLTDSLLTPAVVVSGTFNLLPNNQLRIVATSPASYVDTLGYDINGNELQITIIGSSPGSSFREVYSYYRQ